MILRPEILTHENIPKPLHGRNPRTILGQKWWNIVRKEAYAKNDFRCWACGEHKDDAPYRRYLEAHEFYKIDHETSTVEYVEPVALCHSCHNFIHSGRMFSLLQKGEMSDHKVRSILERGFEILSENNLVAFWKTRFFWMVLNGYSEAEAELFLLNNGSIPATHYDNKWSEWTLKIEDKEYYSLFENEQAWANHYQ